MPEAICIDKPELISLARLCTLKAALRIEAMTGLRHSRIGSVAPDVRKLIGSKTKDKKVLLAELIAFITQKEQEAGLT